MYLSNIEVIGFKSFAQRVNLKFDAGVTAIVGPNGCGKTNIVDAIRWALGEQRYSTLRSDKMEDVIFNGTKSRKPLGLAEVSLVIQNTKGILPTEYSEVTITRRVFRSGESEYALNKVPCRLKDILDLFMDTGMGADAYSVIELKMIETILSDKTDERRRLFEEAAGVTKYKHRRKAAYRKLEDVQKDLERVNDIVKEVQKTVNSLERQAKRAEQHNEVSARLQATEIELLEREFSHLHAKLVPLTAQYALATTDRKQIDAGLREQEEELDRLRGELSGIEKELIEIQRAVGARRNALHKQEEKLLVANERKNSLTVNVGRYEREKIELKDEKVKLELENAELDSKRKSLRDQLAELQKSYADVKAAHHAINARFEEQKLEVQMSQERLLELAHSIVNTRGDVERLKARIDNCQGRTDRSREELQLYQADIEKCASSVSELSSQDRDLRKKFVESEIVLHRQEDKRNTLGAEAESLRNFIAERKNEIERKRQKIEFIRGLVQSGEEFSDGARYLLNEEKWKKKGFLSLADTLKVPDRYRRAIEAALGEAAGYVVVDRLADLRSAIEELRVQQKGKATFVCLERLPEARRSIHASVSEHSSPALDAVTVEAKFRDLAIHLLDRVIIVDTLDRAAGVLAAVSDVTCVTIDGQVAASKGILRGGSAHLSEGRQLGKQEEIDAIESELVGLSVEMQTAMDRLAIVVTEHDGIDVGPLRAGVKAIEKEMTAIEVRIAQVEFEKKRANDGIERNMREQEHLDREIGELRLQHGTAGVELAERESQKNAEEQRLSLLTAALETVEKELAESSRAVNEQEIHLVKLQGDCENVEQYIERNRSTISSAEATLLRRDEEITRSAEEIQRLNGDIESLNAVIETLRNEYETDEQTLRRVEETYSQRRNEVHSIELQIRDERRLHEDSVAAAHELEMKIAEIKSSAEHLRLRAEEEFELVLEPKEYPADEAVDFSARREEIKAMKDRLRALSPVNFAAFDEFKSESERLTFLTQQRDDLIEAEKTLVATIEEINATAQRKFMDTFVMIRENFIKTFKELFQEGDHCDLKLEEDVDPLEAGIEIFAQPRGKRPTSIDLLSGGEKTLTAIALLFAIYLVKPSPFCILDEVDAPLDDSNIDRYTRILKKFSNNTQFIVVTHNKRTMEAASALYGVTMEEEGISKIVTVRFSDEAKVRSATLASGG